jgi:hypothetical protein
VELAIALHKDAGVTREEAAWVVKEVNRGFSEPKDEHEVDRIIAWAYNEEG